MADEQEARPHYRADVEVSHTEGAVTLKTPAGGVTLTADEAQSVASRLVEASARAGGQDPDENDLVRIPMQYIRAAAERLEYEVEGAEGAARPPEDDEMGDAKFAEVHCWIRDQTERNAMHIAAGWVAEHGWVITEVLEQAPVTRDDFEGSEYVQYYQQALIDSEVFLYEIEEDDGEGEEGSADAS